MKRMLIKVAAIAITFVTCTSCSASAKDRKVMYEEFGSFSPEYTEFVETVAEADCCNPWDIGIRKHMEYSIIQNEKGRICVGKQNVPVYGVYNHQTGEEIIVYSPSEYTTGFALSESDILNSAKPAVNQTLYGFEGTAIAELYGNRNA